MRICKSFLFLVALLLCLGVTTTQAQSVSDSDFFALVPATVNVDNVDTSFTMTVYIDTKTPASAMTIPLSFDGGNANLSIDTTKLDAYGNKGVTQLAAGTNGSWTIRTSLVDGAARTIKMGYVSFGLPLAPMADSLVRIHFKLAAGSSDAVHSIDTTFIPPADKNVTITGEDAQDRICQWAKGTISIGPSDVQDGITPLRYGLDQNYPNPFNAQTRISFSLAKPGKVQLVVFNLLGQKVNTLIDREMPADQHSIVWDGTNAQGGIVASGTYFYRLKIGDAFEETRQMTLLK